MPLNDLPVDELRKYRSAGVEPADFDDFWAETIAAARDVPMEVVRERVDTGLRLVEVDDLSFPGFGGHPVRAWLIRPAGASGRLPVVIGYQGYGGGRGLPHEHLAWANAGYAHLVMDTRGQGSVWGSGGVTPDPVGSGPAGPGMLTRGLGDPTDHYYRRLFVDAVRAVDAARALPGIDPSRIAVTGHSQGAGMALAAAGLVGDLSAAMVNVPFLCDFRRAAEIADSGPYGEIVAYLAVHRDQVDTAFRTLSYLDGVSFARRALAPALFSVALMDPVCPPSTVYAAYNGYGELTATPHPTEIVEYPFNKHEGGDGHHFARQVKWLAERW